MKILNKNFILEFQKKLSFKVEFKMLNHHIAFEMLGFWEFKAKSAFFKWYGILKPCIKQVYLEC